MVHDSIWLIEKLNNDDNLMATIEMWLISNWNSFSFVIVRLLQLSIYKNEAINKNINACLHRHIALSNR